VVESGGKQIIFFQSQSASFLGFFTMKALGRPVGSRKRPPPAMDPEEGKRRLRNNKELALPVQVSSSVLASSLTAA
jgi:hypothetical protein